MKKGILITVFLILSVPVIWGQGVSDPCRKSTEGNNFWFGFMESRNYSNAHYLEITVTARETTTFKIFIGKAEVQFNSTYTVFANNRVQVQIPWDMVEALGSEKVQDKGIHLVSEKPVNVYALNYDSNSADVAVIYPIESLGTEYFAICYDVHIHERNDGTYGNGRNSQFLVVAADDSTNVLIIPSVDTDSKVKAGDSIEIILNKGEVYQVQSMNFENLAGQGDLTGSYISSDKPIAFYSGSLATTVPASSGTSAWDHLYEQIPPVHSWGREYFAAPLKSREQDRYRIMAAENNTTVQISGLTPFTLQRGEFKELVFFYNEPKRIFADKPIMVAQYSQSRSVDNDYTGGNGDPFMIILSSTTQSKNDVTFVAYDSDRIKRYFVNIISLTEEIPNIRFDGASMSSSEFKPFPDSDYSYAQKEIQAGSYRINNTNPDRGFLAYVYGYGGVESYGYGVGFNLDLVLDLGESINFNGDTLLLCYGETRTLDAGPYFDTYNWNTGDTTQTLKVNDGGNFYVKTTTIDGCVLEDSIHIYMSKPETELGLEYDEGCDPYSVELNGNDGFQKYLWQNETDDTLSMNQLYTADQTGEYRVTVFDEYNCKAMDTMNLVVFPVPDTEIQGISLICGVQTGSLDVDITGAPETVWNFPGNFQWSSNRNGVSFLDSSHSTTHVKVSEWGEYDIYYQLTTIDGCTTGDTFTIAFYPTPTSEFSFVEDPDDECQGYHRQVLYDGNATARATYFWDYGGSKLIDSLDWNNFTVSIGAYNTFPFLTLFVEENGCWSDTTVQPIGANPDFKLETGKARGCDSLTVLFKGQLNVQDSLLFEWDFGDGSPLSNLQSKLHHYTDTGYYNVSLTISNLLTGCKIGFEIDSMVKVFPTPVAHITADPLLCYADTADVIYTYNIDSSFCTWQFTGAHQLGSGNDSINIMIDEPIATVGLTVEEYGCVSDPVEVQLKRKPHFDFSTANEEGCQPYQLEVFADPLDDGLEFTWITDSLPYPSSASAFFYLPDSGRFDITLAGQSTQTGCSDTLIKKDWIWVHPKPMADFEVDYPVALIEHADITFSNFSVHANQFNWDFDDGEFSGEFEPMHTYTELGEYTSKLYVESEYGCLDTAELLITILPFNVFTPNAFRPNSDIPENRTFMPVGLGADASRFTLKVFDRWGQVVFETNTPEHPWDGNNRNGKPAPTGNYVWISHFYDVQGFEHNQKGQVILIR